jgi:hypothetical protein
MTQYTVTLNSPNQYSVTTNTEQLQLSLSRTGPQGAKGDSVSSAYIDLNGDFHVVIINAAGDTVTDINLGGENYIASAVAAEAAALAAQTAAESAQTAAEIALDTLDDVFLGPKPSAPTLDNDGDPLTEGALYWNTTTNELGVYEGSAWEYPAQEARTYSISAAASASSASTSATNAATSEVNSANSAFASSTSAAAALQDAVDAHQSASDSQFYAGQANTSASSAATSESNAATSETNAGNSATASAASASLSQTKSAESYNSAVSALSSKNAAATSEINAAGSALDSFNYSQVALTSKNAAATSEINALNSKNAAAASAAAALVSEADALTAADASATSATASATSATASATSATAALTSETASATSETNAAASETAAGLSEVASANSATAAALSETNAAASEALGATSAAAAVNSATAAATSETNAGLSEVASANSAIAAALSQTASATSETAAAGSAASAASDLASVQAIFDQFDDRYLGAYATDPTTDNDGNSLAAGTVYWNTTDSVLKFYNGAAWEAPSASAATSAANALASEQASATSASNASSSETASALSASAALASETATATSEANAASSEATASTAASAALASETAAATSETNAASSASSSLTSANASAASASAALASETASATSATASATSETNAASSALAASNSETSAAASSTSAGNSATAALTSETAAATSETNAASSALDSANSATASATSASNSNTSALASASSASAASASETAASGSASAASSSASAAATSETNAAASEANASTSETNAASSAASAAASYDSFDDRYLGAKASAPAVDNDGNALLLGALYWNTTSNNMYVWEGSLWKQATGSIEGIREEFVFTSTAGQTVFSGLDDNGLTLVMDALELVDVFLNGIKIVKGIDYTLDILNNTVTFASGRTLNDIVSVHSFGNFTAATNSLNIVGGSVNGSPIGNTTADSGTFTNLTATGTTSVGTITGSSLTATQSATLQQAGSTKLQTTTTGVDVTGTITSDGLTVDGDVVLNDQSINVGSTANSYNELRFFDSINTGGTTRIRSSASNLEAYTANAKRISIATNGDVSFYEDTGTTPKFFWDASAESLGIGTSSPTSDLSVGSTSTSSGDIALRTTKTAATIVPSNVAAGGLNVDVGWVSGGQGPLTFSLTGSEKMRIDASGNVGIGTAAPSRTLSVNGVAGFGNGTIETVISYSDRAIFGTQSNHALEIRTNGAERMRIDSSGNVLVGTTNVANYNNNAGTTADDGFVYNSINGVLSVSSYKANANVGFVQYLNRTNTDGGIIELRKDGASVGSIGSYTGDNLTIGTGATGVRFDVGLNTIMPHNVTTNANQDATIVLGNPSVRFKNLYLSGGVYLGGTGAANKLDDVEEGTFMPSIYSGPTGVTHNIQDGYYYKVGSIVFIRFIVRFNCTGGAGATVKLTGLPYLQNVVGSSWLAAGSFGGSYNTGSGARTAAIEGVNNIFWAGNDSTLSTTGTNKTIEGTFVYATYS